VPFGADETVYLVIDSFSSGTVYRETGIEEADLESVLSDLLSGQYNSPVRVVAFNMLEHWPPMCELSPNFGDGRAGQAAAVMG
jgi:hypothetical protein